MTIDGKIPPRDHDGLPRQLCDDHVSHARDTRHVGAETRICVFTMGAYLKL